MNKIQVEFNKINKNIVDNEGKKNVLKVLKSGFLSKPEGGHYVKLFQDKMSNLLDKKYSFATTSGTTALHAAIVSIGLKENDEVLVPALTFFADASVVIQEHAIPVFVDVSDKDFNLNPVDIERKITKKTKAIIVVHLYGQPANLDKLIKIARKYKLVLIEDCAQAMGAKYKNKFVGSFGDISCFSFYQTKHLVTGEGGMILTSNKKYADSLRSLLNNGIKRADLDAYDFDRIGFNYQMTEIQAALAISQLARLGKLNDIRRRNAKIYKELLSKTEIQFQKENINADCVYCYLTGLLPEKLANKRDLFISKVLNAGIPIKKQYPLSLPETNICRNLSLGDPRETPVATDISKRVINFYVNPGLETKDIVKYSKIILKIYNGIS